MSSATLARCVSKYSALVYCGQFKSTDLQRNLLFFSKEYKNVLIFLKGISAA